MSLLALELAAQVGPLAVRAAFDTRHGPVALVGPNGSGKTSILRLLLGVLRAESGRVSLGDEVLFDAARGIDVRTEERRFGYLPQSYGLFPHLTVAQNVEFALRGDAGYRTRAARRSRALELLSRLDVASLAERDPRLLSGGERQRVALVRALAARPRALLLDEPLAALDPGSRRRVRRFLAEYLRELGLPTLLVTHDPLDAAALASFVVVVEDGRVVQQGTLAELAAAPASRFVEEFQGALAECDPPRR